MNNIQAWQAIVAAVAPFVIAFINKPTWSSYTKRLVLIGVALVFALVTMYFDGSLLPLEGNVGALMSKVVLAIGAVQAAYTVLTQVRPTRVALTWFEAFTSGFKPDEAVAAKASVNQQQLTEYKEAVK